MEKKKVAKKSSKNTKATKKKSNVVHRDIATRNSDESPLIKINQSTILTAVIFLLVGLIVGALAVGAIGSDKSVLDSTTCTVDLGQNEQAVKEKVTSYLNNNLRQAQMVDQGLEFILEDSNNLSENTLGYEVFVSDGSGLNQPAGAIIYVSGDNFVIAQSAPISLNEEIEQVTASESQEQTVDSATLSEEDESAINEFASCLADAGLVVYGANWCGYTKALMENIGGFELASPVYVECTENEELCSSEGVTGYPTIKLNGEVINPQRTMGGLSQVTGCEVPQISFAEENNEVKAGSCN
jgi:hypothetical protein